LPPAADPRTKATSSSDASESAAVVYDQPNPPVARPPNGAYDPLSAQAIRLNAHVSYLDPPFALSFPTLLAPDPITQIGHRFNGSGIKAAVTARAGYVCHYCGLRARKYQEVVGPVSTVTAAEAHLACIFCAQVMALDLVHSMRSGVLIHLPEVGQARLHACARIIYVCRISQGRAADLARRVLDAILTRRARAKARLGSDDPGDLVTMLVGCRTEAEAEALRRQLDGIRLFPLDRRLVREMELEFNQFPQILAYYRSKDGPFGGLPPKDMDLRAFEATFAGLTATA